MKENLSSWYRNHEFFAPSFHFTLMEKNEFKIDSLPNLQIDTGEVRQPRKKDGPLFYILPPLIVAAVFYYCATTPPPVRSGEPKESVPEQNEATEESSSAADRTEDNVNGDEN